MLGPASASATFGTAPSSAATRRADSKLAAMMKNFGFSLAAYATLAGSVVCGADAAKSLGYAYAVFLMSVIDGLFISKGFEEISSSSAHGRCHKLASKCLLVCVEGCRFWEVGKHGTCGHWEGRRPS